MTNQLTRREFLKLCGASSVGLTLAACGVAPTSAPTATLARTNMPTLTSTPAPTSTALATVTPTSTNTPTPTSTATATAVPTLTATPTRMPSFEDLQGGSQNVTVLRDTLVNINPDRTRTIQNGGNITIIDAGNDPIYKQIVNQYGYADTKALIATAVGNLTNRRVQTPFVSSLAEDPLKPPYALLFPFKLSGNLSIGAGGWLNLLTTVISTDFGVLANTDILPDLTVNLNIKYPEGSTYKYLHGPRLKLDQWYILEFRDNNGNLVAILHAPTIKDETIVGWEDVMIGSGLSLYADTAIKANKAIEEPSILWGHAGSIYGVNIAENSSVQRGPLTIKKIRR